MITIKGKEYTLDGLVELRVLIEKAINHLEDKDAIIGTTLFPLWTDLLADEYVFTQEDVDAGFRCQYNDVLYKVLQPHTVQETWTPEASPSLFAVVLIPNETVIPEWVQPDSTNPYMRGDRVAHNEKTWESSIDNNTWEPGTVGTETLWVEVTE